MVLNLNYKLTLWPIVVIGLLMLTSCDGGIYIKGRVYAQSAPVGDSQAFIDQPHSVNPDLSHIKGAKVTLYHAGD